MADDLQQLYELFIANSHEELTHLEHGLVELEQGESDPERLSAIRRGLHTLKGGCSMFGLTAGSQVAHALEDLVAAAIKQGRSIGDLVSLFFEGVDLLRGAIDYHSRQGDEPPTAPQEAAILMERIELLTPEEESAASRLQTTFEKLREQIQAVADELQGLYDFDPLLESAEHLGEQIVPQADDPQSPGTETLSSEEEPTIPSAASPKNGNGNGNGTEANGEGRTMDKTVRVSEQKIDNFLHCVGELISASETAKHLRTRIQRDGMTGEIKHDFQMMALSLEENAFELQADLMEIRRVTIAGVLLSLPRLARDMGQDLGKVVEVETSGQDAVVDKSFLDKLQECLVQIIRNAMAHGIETVSCRREAGKPDTGHIRIHAANEDKFLVLKISDDGAGLDLDKIRRRARDLGVVSNDQLDRMNDEDTAMLIFASGLSTAASVGMESGRGVGLDVVASDVSRLGGHISVTTKSGRGTTILLRIPLDATLSVISGIIASAGTKRFVVPVSAMQESVYPKRDMLQCVQNAGETILLRDQLIPMHRAGKTFQIANAKENATDCVAMILQSRERRAALLFDAVHDIQQIVVKNIEGLPELPGIAGGAVLGDGGIGLVLNVERLLADWQR